MKEFAPVVPLLVMMLIGYSALMVRLGSKLMQWCVTDHILVQLARGTPPWELLRSTYVFCGGRRDDIRERP